MQGQSVILKLKRTINENKSIISGEQMTSVLFRRSYIGSP